MKRLTVRPIPKDQQPNRWMNCVDQESSASRLIKSARALAHSKTWPAFRVQIVRLRFGVRHYCAAFPFLRSNHRSLIRRHHHTRPPGIQLLCQVGKETFRCALDENVDLAGTT